MKLNNWRLWLGLGITLTFLVFLCLQFNPDELLKALSKANYFYLIPAIVIYFIGMYFRALRWQYVLSPIQLIPVRRLYPVLVIGYAANNILPARIGELVRAYYLAQREQFSGSSALATIGVERIYDGLTLLFFGALSALMLVSIGAFGGIEENCQLILINASCHTIALASAGAAGAVFLIGLAVVILLASNRWVIQNIDRSLGLLPLRFRSQAREIVHNFILGLSILNSPKRLLSLAVRSLPVWIGEGAVYFIIALSFNINGYFDSVWAFALGIILVTAVSNLATAVPISLGSIGPFEFIAQLTLASMGTPGESALSYALATHLLALWLPVNLVGFVLMWQQNLSLKQLTNAKLSIDQEPSGQSKPPTGNPSENP